MYETDELPSAQLIKNLSSLIIFFFELDLDFFTCFQADCRGNEKGVGVVARDARLGGGDQRFGEFVVTQWLRRERTNR